MIRTSKHTLKYCNNKKQQDISSLVDDYRLLVQNIIDHIWSHGYGKLNVAKNKLSCSKFADSKFLKKFNWSYTERLKQCAAKQALAMISAATKKRKQQLWMLKELQKQNVASVKYLQRAISLQKLVKPNASNVNLELDSRFVDFKFDEQNKFLCFIKLTSIKLDLDLKIPVVKSAVYDKWNGAGQLSKSIRLSKNSVNLIFKVPEAVKNSTGDVVACDQGITDIITLSDKQTCPKYQGKFDLSDVLNILSRKKKGSAGFRRAQEFRKNVINWSINQLDFSNIRELRVERLHQVRTGKKCSRFLSHWTYTLINEKLNKVSEEKGFLFREVSNEFRSQRCSRCGWVCKANRSGKTFCCKECNNKLDADLNAASNLLLDLYEIPYWVRSEHKNIAGFYWKPDGLYDKSHEQIVHDA